MTRRYTGGFLSSKEQVTDVNSANGVYTTQEAGALTAAGTFPTGRWTPQNSLRFRKSVNGYLSRTPSSAGSSTTWTWSAWIKRAELNSSYAYTLFQAGAGSTYLWILWSDNQIYVQQNPSSTVELRTTAVFRDPSAWYHIVFTADTTQAIASNRFKIYVNGVLQTSLATATYPAQNAGTIINSVQPHYIGSNLGAGTAANDGYISEMNHIDGQALDPTYFGATDPQTGTWVPKRYTGTYGTNGFYLPFNNNAPDSSAIDVLVVAGGGGGGSTAGGGGGGGGFREATLAITTSTTYTVTVGAGGSGDNIGNNSVFGTVTSDGGGRGCSFLGGGTGTAAYSAGGSGGGAGGRGQANVTQPGGTATAYQGNTGGTSLTSSYGGGGGGGGAGSTGGSGSYSGGGSGGSGKVSTITGSTYAGGGGGGIDNGIGSYGSGGSGGGGGGGAPGNVGSGNTGGGGGGGSNPSGAAGGTGGSGIVVLKYPDTRTITIGTGLTGSTAAPSGGFKVTTITVGTGTVSFA